MPVKAGGWGMGGLDEGRQTDCVWGGERYPERKPGTAAQPGCGILKIGCLKPVRGEMITGRKN